MFQENRFFTGRLVSYSEVSVSVKKRAFYRYLSGGTSYDRTSGPSRGIGCQVLGKRARLNRLPSASGEVTVWTPSPRY